jgi:hypothetical protein
LRKTSFMGEKTHPELRKTYNLCSIGHGTCHQHLLCPFHSWAEGQTLGDVITEGHLVLSQRIQGQGNYWGSKRFTSLSRSPIPVLFAAYIHFHYPYL